MNEKKTSTRIEVDYPRHTAEYDGKVINIDKLIALAESMPNKDVPIERFQTCLEQNYWFDIQGQWIGPSDIVNACRGDAAVINWGRAIEQNPTLAHEIEKVRSAELTYPILVINDTVIDGMHRLTKAVLENRSTICIRSFSAIPSEVIISTPQ